MSKTLSFNIPFSPIQATTFINCFTSTYLFLEKIVAEEGENYVCTKRETGKCSGCGNCRKTMPAIQEKYFFLFDTMCGRSSLRCRYDGTKTEMEKLISEMDFYDGGTDNNIEFLFGFAGYEYQIITNDTLFRKEIMNAIDDGIPVIARVKDESGRFRVITGYDGDKLVCPDYEKAQNKPERPPLYNEIEVLYIIGKKIKPQCTIADGLKRIYQVMDYNMREDPWKGYMDKMGLYTSDSLERANPRERKERMKRVADAMWHTFNCHNFAEVFRNKSIKQLNKDEFDDICNKVGSAYGYTHDLAWALIELEKSIDWSGNDSVFLGEMIELTLNQIKLNDITVLEEVKKTMKFLE